MKLTTLSIAGALLCSLAAVGLQCGPQWKIDAAVEAALAAGDFEQAREMAISAKHWRQILEAEYGHPDANQPSQALERVSLSDSGER